MNARPAPELLMPAGSPQKLEYAFAYGADAAYLGVPFFSLRARENEFDLAALENARNLANRLNKKIYITANVFAKNRKLTNFLARLDEWVQLKPDALIMGDPGLMAMARERYPDLPIHLSVQANAMNWQSVRFWHRSLNISRIILSRELHLDDIREIKDRVPDVELEAFVHGSLCIAYSGRCLMSSYMSYRDANQGVCDNSCREKFKVYAAPKKETEDSHFFLEDMRAEGTLYQIDEDENGTFIMNAKDLRLIQHLKEIYDAGVCSFKVEGRTKSVNYVALVAKAYRAAIDDMMAERPFNSKLLTDLEKIAHRGYDTGFMIRQNPGAAAQNYETSVSRHFTQKFGGLISQELAPRPGFIPVEIRNRLAVGQKCELATPNTPATSFTVQQILNARLEPVEVAHGGAGHYYIALDTPSNLTHGILSVEP